MKVFDLAAAKQKAYRLLSLRPHSEKELKKKLREKGFPSEIVEEALEKLRNLKYLDDKSFAPRWARNLAVNKLWGNKKIILSLREKGIDGDLISVAVEKARQEMPEEEAIEALIKKKTAKKKLNILEQKEKQKIFQSLLGRGFPAGLILRKLGEAKEGEFDDENG
ncbi:MAG: RecX family transcriptional regulator [Syntrophaceae bacterium]|nr:RecX family transcriptional regulator [Syntrophaceae bacterium]